MKHKKGIRIGIAVLVLLLAGGFGLFFLTNKSNDNLVDSSGQLPLMGGDVQDGVFTKGMTEEEIQQAMQAIADKSNFTLQISPVIRLQDSQSPGSIEIANPKSNAYPINVDIVLEDGELIYRSGAIQPGQYIAEGNMLKSLPKGQHKAIAEFNIYSEDGKKLEGKTTVDVTIEVEN